MSKLLVIDIQVEPAWQMESSTKCPPNGFNPELSIILRVPTAPGKPGKMKKAFPVMEISWNFEILQNIMEKMRRNLEK